MSIWLDAEDLELVRPAEQAFETPIPVQVVSNGEYLPPPRTPAQARVAAELDALAARLAPRQGLSRRQFLRTNLGLAAAFLAMNRVYGAVFAVESVEAEDRAAATERSDRLRDQFIFDVQLHFVRDDYPSTGILGLRRLARDLGWNPELPPGEPTLRQIQFENFVKEVFLDSETTVGLLSGAPADDPRHWFLGNNQIAQARARVNAMAGTKRLFAHAIFTPRQPGWLEEVDRAITELKPDSWKCYTLGDPGGDSSYPWRLDDAELVYPAYERMLKAGIRNICIHKGLVPPDFEKAGHERWRYAGVDDVGQAARDWPQLNFIIYHNALANLAFQVRDPLARFEETGRMPWVNDLAEIPAKFGVNNVHAEIGTSFATSAIIHPAFCGAMLGTLIKGMGVDHVVWGTDSVWYGSPQWQIEAFRRIEIPERLQHQYGFAPLGTADGPIKNTIFGQNSARLYGIDPARDYPPRGGNELDGLARIRARYLGGGGERSNLAYGYVRR